GVGVSGSDHESPPSPKSSTVATSDASPGAEAPATLHQSRNPKNLGPRQDEGSRTPSPTVTGTPPTATPSRTRRPENDDDQGEDERGRRTPTPTITPGRTTQTPSLTRPPENDDEAENERTKTPTVTPGGPTFTPRPTRTPEPEDDENEGTKTPTITPGGPTLTPTPTRPPDD